MSEENRVDDKIKRDPIYDEAFKGMLQNCQKLIIPIINEMFGEKYSLNAKIESLENSEHQQKNFDGTQEVIKSDSVFTISESETSKKYHIECQSTVDKTMVVRIFEYATQIALDKQNLLELLKPSTEEVTIKFPRSAVLYLRSRGTTPDVFTVNIEIEEQTIPYKIPIMKVKNYNVEEIFEKNLLFLIPFHLFALENKFEQYENDSTKFAELQTEYEGIADRLNKLFEENQLEINYLMEISGWTK